MNVNMIVARGMNAAIGLEGRLPWGKLRTDMQYFKQLTLYNPIIMGRATWESLGAPLPKRTNIIVSSQLLSNPPDGTLVVSSLTDAIKVSELSASGDVFIIGGRGLYDEAVDVADTVYVTEVDYYGEADVHWDYVFGDEWDCATQAIVKASVDDAHDMRMVRYTRKEKN